VLKFSCCRGRVARHAERLATPVSSVCPESICDIPCALHSADDLQPPQRFPFRLSRWSLTILLTLRHTESLTVSRLLSFHQTCFRQIPTLSDQQRYLEPDIHVVGLSNNAYPSHFSAVAMHASRLGFIMFHPCSSSPTNSSTWSSQERRLSLPSARALLLDTMTKSTLVHQAQRTISLMRVSVSAFIFPTLPKYTSLVRLLNAARTPFVYIMHRASVISLYIYCGSPECLGRLTKQRVILLK
jgi:hypothetical protein